MSCTKTCPEGQCQDSTNCTCKECPTSEYPNCAKFTSTACIQCQKGFRLVEGVCIACTSEKYSDNGKECKYCEPGFWPNSNSTGCVECPEGYICNNGIQTKCSGATAPTIEEDILGNKTHVCAPCPEGSYCEDGIEIKCSEKFKDCIECTKDGCVACEEGKILSGGQCAENMDDILLVGDLYITKFNMGDKTSLPIPSSVTILTAGSSSGVCNSGKCCWQGTTATTCDSYNGGYNGCTRTVCNWDAAREICARFELNNQNWRLPVFAEMSGWQNYSNNQGANGLQLCNTTTATQTAYTTCQQRSNSCYGSYNKICYPAYVWSGDNYPSGNYFYVYTYYLSGVNWTSNNSFIGGYAASVRCVASASDCPRGQYQNGASCSSCSSKFNHCATCDSSKCFACVGGYELHPYNNKCYKVIEDAVPVDDLYVTKFNMGDGGLPIPSNVYGCKRGTTADTSTCQNSNTSNNGGYSGCTRTVCDWNSAYEICKNYTAGGKTWRLPNQSEMTNWYKYTISLGAAGPQLCQDSSSTSAPATNCWYSPYYPGCIWNQEYNAANAYYSKLSGTSWRYSGNTSKSGNYYSVRCVSEITYE